MEFEQYNSNLEEKEENEIKGIFMQYLYYWKWFVVSILFCIFLGYIFIRYNPSLYEVKASILIRDDKKGGSVSDELSAFEDLGIFNKKSIIENEIEILKSRTLMNRVVNELKLNITYYSYGRPIEHERYYNTPIQANFILKDSSKQNLTTSFALNPIDNIRFDRCV